MSPRTPQILLGAALLPWQEDFTLDEPVFRKHIRSLIHLGFEHIYVMGTAGEGYALTDRQFEQVVRIFWEEMQKPGLVPMVGLISLSTSQVLERIDWSRRLGVRQFQISLPCWGAVSDSEMLMFFQGVCARFPDCQFLHYNLSRAKRVLTGADYRRIADAVPNLVATKNSTSDFSRVADLMTNAPDLQHVFVENAFALGCLFGECSLLPSYALMFPKLAQRHWEMGRNRRLAELMVLHRQLAQLLADLLRQLPGPRIDGAYDKLYAWLRDPTFPLRLLPPYQGFSDQEAALARQVFERDLPRWESLMV
ncbi:MAG: dihydrodipicolinate synthase family protein [Acidobacteriota bacterium]